MVTNCIICMESLYCFLNRLETFFVFLLLLKHFLFIFLFLTLNFFSALCNHIKNISWFFIDYPPILNLFWLKFKFIFFKECVNFSIFHYLHFYLLYFKSNRSIQVVFELACLLNCCCCFFNFILNVRKLL
jgi:hypothetical protein